MIEIIPAIDLIDGQCVRLSQGDYASKKVYHSDPVEVARQFEAIGIRRLHLVDLDGARMGKIQNLAVLEAITEATSLRVDFGGGIKTATDLQDVLNAGALWATVGSMAVKQPEVFAQWVDEFGAENILLGADVKGRKIAVGAWTETSETDIFDFLEIQKKMGITHYFCTDISKDGMLQGTANELYKALSTNFPSMHLIASGGVSSMDDVRAVAEAGCQGVIVGKAIYEGRISLAEIKEFIALTH